jgi:hypothetical protein
MSFFNSFKKGFMDFGKNITLIVNCILLTPVYFIGVGITSIIAKISGKHFIDTKMGKKTYWKELNLKKKPLDEYYRQF